ncbi:hypothetical protein CBP36_21385 (plasmid) [Acidovorax carolinensis]|uniref:KfrB domain-containing protein n=1 Tax=Acidovorax carolinensis TaxID=553814 RepID=A0A240UJ55_9BURK|nr:hypothetical protein [Acidovorax carolinensis]ART61521.1 hypothetical protein CBP36_21385 [Acidovorax carolinensis]
MDRWTENEFQRVARTTRISTRTLDACKDVLVDGMSNMAAAAKHKMFAPQISRAVTTLREKQAEQMKFASIRKESDEMMQYIASEVARHLFGQEFETTLAQPGCSYEGPVVVQSKGYLVQKVGRGGVLHNVAAFDNLPQLQQTLRIDYDAKGNLTGIAQVNPQEKSAKDLGR